MAIHWLHLRFTAGVGLISETCFPLWARSNNSIKVMVALDLEGIFMLVVV